MNICQDHLAECTRTSHRMGVSMSRESCRFESWCFDWIRENHKYYSSPKEYNLQRELRRNYEVLFV
nr:MAG TPA: hypothetical protein [Caudoviricetes sp.]